MSEFNQTDCSDGALIARYRAGDEEACALLLLRYANLINRRIRNVSIQGEESDDLRQEAYMGLFGAIRTFDPSKNVSFCSYASRCVSNSIKNLFAAASTKKAQLYNRTVSLDALEDAAFSGRADVSPEEIFISKEDYETLRERIDSLLSPFEREVLFYYLSGHDYREAAARFGASPKSVDNALQRARRKLKTVLGRL